MEIQNKQIDLVLSAIRTVGASFPIASSFVNAWNEYSISQKEEKVLLLVADLLKKIENLETSITKSKKECAEIFQLGLEYAQKEPHIKKIPMYSSLIIAFCTGQINKDAVSNLIYECETILPYDFETLYKLSKTHRVDEAFRYDEETKFEEISQRQSSIKKLESKGFLAITGDISSDLHRVYEQKNIWPFSFFVQFYIVMNNGRILLKLLN